MSAPSTASVVFLLSPPRACHDCGDLASWFAAGVSGCSRRCGARGGLEWDLARAAVFAYVKRNEARLRRAGLGQVVDEVLRTFAAAVTPASAAPRQLAAAGR